MILDPAQDFQEDVAALLADDDPADGSTLSERGFLMAAEGTRHVWETPEEDEAWVHLQERIISWGTIYRAHLNPL